MRDQNGLDMECEGPQYLRCGMLEPLISTPPRVTIISSSKYMTMPHKLVYVRGLPFHSQGGGVRFFFRKLYSDFRRKKKLYFDILRKKNCTMIDRKKCVLHLSGENLLGESIWMAGVKVNRSKTF